MHNLIVSCGKDRMMTNIRTLLEEEILPLPVRIHTVAPEQLPRRLQGWIDILLCDCGVMRQHGERILEMYRQRPELFLIILGGKGELVQLREAMDIAGDSRLQLLMLPFSRRELIKQVCTCTYASVDKRLEDSPDAAYSLWTNNRRIVRERFWYDLLSGRFGQYTTQSLLRAAEAHDVRISGSDKLFLPFFIHIHWEPPRGGEMKGEDRLYAMRNLMEEIFEIDDWSIPIVTLSPRRFAVIWHYSSEATLQRAQKARDAYVQCYKAILQREVTCELGEPTTLAGLSSYSGYLLGEDKNPDAEEGQTGQIQDPVVEIKQFIDRNINRALSRKMIAEQVYLNADYMATLFKKKTGQCLSGYITQKKMEKARSLLIRDGRSITEVAAELGYTNFSYFSRIFKSTVGLTPSEYRQQYYLTAENAEGRLGH